MTQMTHEMLDTPVHKLSNNELMMLKHEMCMKVRELAKELETREEVG